MTVTGIARVTVSVADLGRSLALYRDALGMIELYQDGDRAMLSVPGSKAIQWQLHRRQPSPSTTGVAISLLVANVDASTSAAIAAGAQLVRPAADEPWGERQAVLTDPDGHLLCLVAPAVR